MSGFNNESINAREISKFRAQLKAMIADIETIDEKVLNKSVNTGLANAKRNTPVGKTTKGHKGGFMRKSWKVSPTIKSIRGVEKELFNTAEYALYVNAGHRIVVKGNTVGFVPGKFILEKAIKSTEYAMVRNFRKEIERVEREHGE